MITVGIREETLWVKCPYDQKAIVSNRWGGKWNKQLLEWQFPATPHAAHQIDAAIQNQTVEAEDSFIALVEDYHRIQAFKAHTEMRTNLWQAGHEGMKMEPWEHQAKSFHILRCTPNYMLAFDMRTGKTKATIDHIFDANYKTILVICPKTVMRVWPAEFKKHAWTDEYFIHPLLTNQGSVPVRADVLRGFINVHSSNTGDFIGWPRIAVINYDVIWRPAMLKALKETHWDLIVLDESHRIKAPNGSASKAVCQLSAKHKICLTGTPTPHSPLDLFGQMRFLDPSLFGRYVTQFKDHYCRLGGYSKYQITGWKNEKEMQDKFDSISLVVRLDDVVDLPPVAHQEISLDMPDNIATIYKELEKEFIALVGDNVITAPNALVKLIRLQQLTSGFVKNEDGHEVSFHSVKRAALLDLITDLPRDEPVIVFCRFQNDLANIRSACQDADRRHFELSGHLNMLAEWQAEQEGDNRGGVIGVQIQSGKEGIDMSMARYCVFYSQTWSLGDYEQALARPRLPGKNQSVIYYHLVTRDTIDGVLYKSLRDKRGVIDQVLTSLRRSKTHGVQRSTEQSETVC